MRQSVRACIGLWRCLARITRTRRKKARTLCCAPSRLDCKHMDFLSFTRPLRIEAPLKFDTWISKELKTCVGVAQPLCARPAMRLGTDGLFKKASYDATPPESSCLFFNHYTTRTTTPLLITIDPPPTHLKPSRGARPGGHTAPSPHPRPPAAARRGRPQRWRPRRRPIRLGRRPGRWAA